MVYSQKAKMSRVKNDDEYVLPCDIFQYSAAEVFVVLQPITERVEGIITHIGEAGIAHDPEIIRVLLFIIQSLNEFFRLIQPTARKVFHHRDTDTLQAKIRITIAETTPRAKPDSSGEVTWMRTQVPEVRIEETGWFLIHRCTDAGC